MVRNTGTKPKEVFGDFWSLQDNTVNQVIQVTYQQDCSLLPISFQALISLCTPDPVYARHHPILTRTSPDETSDAPTYASYRQPPSFSSFYGLRLPKLILFPTARNHYAFLAPPTVFPILEKLTHTMGYFFHQQDWKCLYGVVKAKARGLGRYS